MRVDKRAKQAPRVTGVLAFVALFALVALGASACTSTEPAAADICAEAKNRFAACGTSLPLLTDGPCNGTTRIVARCVVDHAHDCEELASLFGRIDACVSDLLDGGDALLPPATDLPVPGRDAGRDGAAEDAARGLDAAPRPTEAGVTDAATDGEAGTETRP